jgi:octaprenyl-diphosphate synthase
MTTPFALIHEDLKQVESEILKYISSDVALIPEIGKHIFLSGGKRFRPALLILCCRLFKPGDTRCFMLAGSIELIHTATLIHDDVLDEAVIRRHLDTVNARWGNEVSVLLGDYLFARSICLVTAANDNYASQVIGDASRIMCEGELRQVESRGNFGLTEEQYVDIISAKTAALCACCCRLGAYCAGADRETEDAFARYGRQLGIAFQITDDVLDVQGDEAVVGKSLGTDLVKQKSTLPLIRLLGQASAEDRSRLVAILTGTDNHYREALRPWFQRSDSLAYAQQRAEWYAQDAKSQLDVALPGAAAESLRRLADFVVRRQQ